LTLKTKIHCTYLCLSDSDCNANEIIDNITRLADLNTIIIDRITKAADKSGSDKKRRITGKAPARSPLGYSKETDVGFVRWCEIGAAYVAITGGRNVFIGPVRQTIGAEYRAGWSVVQVCTKALHNPNAFKLGKHGTPYANVAAQ